MQNCKKKQVFCVWGSDVCGSLQTESLVSLVWSVHSCPQRTHTTHTHLWVSISLNFVFSLSLIRSFPLSHLSAFRPLSLSEQVKNKDPPKIATKVTPPFIHPSLCPSILPVTHPLLTPRPAAGGGGCPPCLCLSLCCITGGGDGLSPRFSCPRMQLSPIRSLTASRCPLLPR